MNWFLTENPETLNTIISNTKPKNQTYIEVYGDISDGTIQVIVLSNFQELLYEAASQLEHNKPGIVKDYYIYSEPEEDQDPKHSTKPPGQTSLWNQ